MQRILKQIILILSVSTLLGMVVLTVVVWKEGGVAVSRKSVVADRVKASVSLEVGSDPLHNELCTKQTNLSKESSRKGDCLLEIPKLNKRFAVLTLPRFDNQQVDRLLQSTAVCTHIANTPILFIHRFQFLAPNGETFVDANRLSVGDIFIIGGIRFKILNIHIIRKAYLQTILRQSFNPQKTLIVITCEDLTGDTLRVFILSIS